MLTLYNPCGYNVQCKCPQTVDLIVYAVKCLLIIDALMCLCGKIHKITTNIFFHMQIKLLLICVRTVDAGQSLNRSRRTKDQESV